jgi:hypothetical protein
LFSYVDLEKRVGAEHPLRVIRGVVNATLSDLSAAFDALYSPFGRESIPPERLLRCWRRRCAEFLAAVLAQPKVKALLSTEHFSVDGTLPSPAIFSQSPVT